MFLAFAPRKGTLLQMLPTNSELQIARKNFFISFTNVSAIRATAFISLFPEMSFRM